MAGIAAATLILWMQLLVLVLQLRISHAALSFNPACPSALISLGDSSADTGNAEIVFPIVMPAQYPPYGMTYFRHPANRFSDGRLVIDFIAQALNLPLLKPDLGQSPTATLFEGINFAVAGAVAIGGSSQLSFSTQIERFNTLVNSEANRGNPIFSDALYVISIGTNDFYNSLAVQKMSEEAARSLIAPQVVDAIANAVRNIYNQGGRNFVVVNVYAQGCTPSTLTLLDPTNIVLIDNELGCLSSYNQVIQDYNNQLRQRLQYLTVELEGANIANADVYRALIDMLSYPRQYGFQDATKLDACCGSGGTHNYNAAIECNEISNICSNPSSYISWDGIHLTEAAYRVIAGGVITGQYLEPSISLSTTCETINMSNIL